MLAHNDTERACPIFDNKKYNSKEEFIVLAHNTNSQQYTQLVRISLPTARFRVQAWSKDELKFVDTEYDIIEQTDLQNNRVEVVSYTMFIPANLQPNEVGYFKILRTQNVRDRPTTSDSSKNGNALTIEGITPQNEALFQYKNKDQGVTQKFGFNLKYYRGE